jgi:hypothetical protein
VVVMIDGNSETGMPTGGMKERRYRECGVAEERR